MTRRELIKEGVSFIGPSDGALLDCEVLLMRALGVSREQLVMDPEVEVSGAAESLYREYLGRVKQGEPVAYIIQEKEFFGLNFFVDGRVLIPRPETERVVELGIEFIKNNPQGRDSFKALDVGTGSGAIAVSLAKTASEEGVDIFVDAADVSSGALTVARVNAEQYGVEDRVAFVESDLLDFLEDGEDYDLILANLPYIGEVRNRIVDKNVEKYEPGGALFGGEGGLELYKKMFQQIAGKSISFGVLIGEFGFAQVDEMKGLLSIFFDQRWVVEKDYAGIDRVFIVTNIDV